MRIAEYSANGQRKPHTPEQFSRANGFLKMLQQNSTYLTMQERSALRTRALDGDIDGAYWALDYIIKARFDREGGIAY